VVITQMLQAGSHPRAKDSAPRGASRLFQRCQPFFVVDISSDSLFTRCLIRLPARLSVSGNTIYQQSCIALSCSYLTVILQYCRYLLHLWTEPRLSIGRAYCLEQLMFSGTKPVDARKLAHKSEQYWTMKALVLRQPPTGVNASLCCKYFWPDFHCTSYKWLIESPTAAQLLNPSDTSSNNSLGHNFVQTLALNGPTVVSRSLTREEIRGRLVALQHPLEVELSCLGKLSSIRLIVSCTVTNRQISIP
jgi:hypothetical protein